MKTPVLLSLLGAAKAASTDVAWGYVQNGADWPAILMKNNECGESN